MKQRVWEEKGILEKLDFSVFDAPFNDFLKKLNKLNLECAIIFALR